ncbi:hypothetical protein NLM33_41805 [Bradyrhizobium sp. CCGUVB1N3]|uniref:hypothetical protein n=1 Tax=Bradyrhizobium sp. CCGUVB1N3 TaxID=2949629 RepID=UPI0020B1AC53|nr:hypothetical protein [Bradyrhizobium sp. CCGUVB1N3]MCP3476701.1 hypothetical protein [Bradyrhizobium sp. CCGUVB1N3]
MSEIISSVGDFVVSHEQLLGRMFAVSALTFALYRALWQLKDNHPREIYAIWYVFSLFFVIFSGLSYVATIKQIQVTSVCGEYASTCKTLLSYLVNVQEELTLVSGLLAIGIIPQLLTYFLSGLSGSASKPMFVWHIEQFAVWSLIKFGAGFGGVTMGIAIGQFAADKPPVFDVYFGAAMFVFGAFYLAALETWLREGLPTLWRRHEAHLWMLLNRHGFAGGSNS